MISGSAIWTDFNTLSTGHITETHMHSIAMTCSSAICTDFNTLSVGCIPETHMHLNVTITSSAVTQTLALVTQTALAIHIKINQQAWPHRLYIQDTMQRTLERIIFVVSSDRKQQNAVGSFCFCF